MNYSVLMSIYHKDNPDWLKEAMDSMLGQTIKPSEFIIVKDGLVGDNLNDIISEYEQECPTLFKIIQREKNGGAGAAKRHGIKFCTSELVAIMDSDDIALPNRIEESLKKFKESPELDAVGSLIDEFTGTISNVVSHVVLPETHEEIVNFAKKRCPIRHTSMLLRKSAVLESGNYSTLRFGEEYELVVRMLLIGKRFYNIQEVLCYMRVNDAFYKRRGGFRHLKDVHALKSTFVKNGFFSRKDFLFSFMPHAIVILMPVFMREFVYKMFLRG